MRLLLRSGSEKCVLFLFIYYKSQDDDDVEPGSVTCRLSSSLTLARRGGPAPEGRRGAPRGGRTRARDEEAATWRARSRSARGAGRVGAWLTHRAQLEIPITAAGAAPPAPVEPRCVRICEGKEGGCRGRCAARAIPEHEDRREG